MEKVVILSGVRTAIGGYGGSLKDVPVYRLGGVVLAEAAKRAKVDPAMIDDVILGSAYQNGECANGARMAVLEAGWPDRVPGVVLDRRCCSGLDSIFWGAMKIQTGNAEIVAAGGMDSMSQAELYIPGDIKWGLGGRRHEKYGFMPKGHGALAMWGIPFYDRIQRARVMSQPIARYGELSSMMSWAEVAAKREGITREEADRWTIRSQRGRSPPGMRGSLSRRSFPVPVAGHKGARRSPSPWTKVRDGTRHWRRSPSSSPSIRTACARRRTLRRKNDGAAVVILASERKAKELGVEPLAYFRSCAVAATDPTVTYPAVPASVGKALKRRAFRSGTWI